MQDRFLSYALLVPAFVIVLATTIYPLAYSFVTSFRECDLTRQRRPGDFVGFENYAHAVTETGFQNSLWVTTIFVVTSVALTLLLAMSLALLLRRKSRFFAYQHSSKMCSRYTFQRDPPCRSRRYRSI